ncbi:MAG: helix-turn-helix domain-containing protein [Alphaproteobacteria bacterium]
MSRAEDIFQKLIYFGEDALDEFIINRQTEELFMDFKQTFPNNNKNNSLNSNDRKNLSKSISGFGNSEGGVLIWGVECYRDVEIGDVAKTKVKIQNVHRFSSWLENAISGCTIPSHNRVRNHIISEDENGDGFVATLIPKSELSPLMSTFGNNFYIRSGSNNVPAPYAVLAGMFGQRPQPNIEFVISDKSVDIVDSFENLLSSGNNDETNEKSIRINFAIHGKNESNVIARELYLSCNTDEIGEYNKVRFSNYNQLDYISGVEGQLNLITKPEFRIPPRGIIKFTNVSIVLSQNIDEDFILEGVVGAEGSAPKDFKIYANKNKLRSFVAKVIRSEEESRPALASEFFNEFLVYMK